MNMKLLKAVRELRIHPQRTFLVVLALVLGTWGVGALLVSNRILGNDLAENFQGTQPSHAVLRSEDFARLDLAALRARPDVAGAELRDFSLHRIEVKPDVWIPLWLYGVQDFRTFQVARVHRQAGAEVPPTGTVLVERDALHLANLAPGSAPRVRIGGRVLNVPVSGIVFDPAQAPATQDAFVYAYADRETYASLTGQPSGQRLIIRFAGVASRGDVERAVDVLSRDLAATGVAISSREVPRFNEHPHQWQLNTLLLLIGAIALLAFLMAAVLVSQLMRAILARQVREIGILKAMGASRGQVLGIYVAMLLLLGSVAGLLGIPLAALSGRAFSVFVAGKLNFNILTESVPAGVYIVLTVGSLLLPVVLSLPALLRGTSVTVAAALSDHGIPQATGGLGLTGRLPLALKLAAGNALRNGRRFGVTVLSMALGVAIFSTGFNVRQSLWELLQGVKEEMRYDVMVALGSPVPRETVQRLFGGLNGVERMEMWNGGRGEVTSRQLATEKGVGVVALPVSTPLLAPRIITGRWLRPAEDVEVVLNQQAWDAYGHPEPGSRFRVALGSRQLDVVLAGVVEQFEKPKLYLDIHAYDACCNPEHKVSSVLFVARQRSFDDVMSLKRDVERVIAASDLGVLYVMSQAERVQIIYEHLNIILSTLLLLSLLVLLVSAVGMASATGINVMERTRELGVLRAMGGTPRTILRMVVAEGMLVGVVAILLGLVLAYPLSRVAAVFFGKLMLGELTPLAYAFSPWGLLVTVVATVAFAWLASRIPARTALRISTRQALSYE